jgi:hypothetical protein
MSMELPHPRYQDGSQRSTERQQVCFFKPAKHEMTFPAEVGFIACSFGPQTLARISE